MNFFSFFLTFGLFNLYENELGNSQKTPNAEPEKVQKLKM
jgi:hypothetical protein